MTIMSGSCAAIASTSTSRLYKLSTPCSLASSAHCKKNPCSSASPPAFAPPVALMGASIASKEPVKVTEVDTIFFGCSVISTSSVSPVTSPLFTTSESTVRGHEVASSSALSLAVSELVASALVVAVPEALASSSAWLQLTSNKLNAVRAAPVIWTRWRRIFISFPSVFL